MTEQLFHPPSADDPAVTDSRSPGSILRKLREEAGLSEASVGTALHLTAHYVKALECDEYGKLPGLTFVKGYLRSYARLLKTDVDAVLECFDQHIASMVDAGQRTQQVQRSRRRQDQALRWAFVTGFIIVAGLAGGWWYTSLDDEVAVVADSRSAAAPAVAIADGGSPVTPAGVINPRSQALPTQGGAQTGITMTPAASEAMSPAADAVARAMDSLGNNGEVPGTSPGELTTEFVAGIPAPGTSFPAGMAAGQVPGGDAAANAAGQGDTIATTVVQGDDFTPQADVATLAGTDAAATQATAADPATPTVSQDTMATSAATPAAESTGPATITKGNLTIVTAEAGNRQLTLAGDGQDLLQLNVTGNSWVEIEDSARARLYNDMLRTGDALTIQGAAPFYVLLGDGHQVEVKLNSQVIDFVANIRNDNTARLVLEKQSDAGEQTDGVTH